VLTLVDGIDLVGLAPAGSGVSAYVKCYAGDRLVFTSPTAKYGSAAYFASFSSTVTETAGEPLFFEIWDDRLYDRMLGGFAVYPDRAVQRAGPQTHTTRILWDWKDRSATTRAGVADVRLRTIPVPAATVDGSTARPAR
jgi:hypothetical protein